MNEVEQLTKQLQEALQVVRQVTVEARSTLEALKSGQRKQGQKSSSHTDQKMRCYMRASSAYAKCLGMNASNKSMCTARKDPGWPAFWAKYRAEHLAESARPLGSATPQTRPLGSATTQTRSLYLRAAYQYAKLQGIQVRGSNGMRAAGIKAPGWSEYWAKYKQEQAGISSVSTDTIDDHLELARGLLHMLGVSRTKCNIVGWKFLREHTTKASIDEFIDTWHKARRAKRLRRNHKYNEVELMQLFNPDTTTQLKLQFEETPEQGAVSNE